MSQVLCFDYGTKSIGVAIGNTLIHSTKSLPALRAHAGKPQWQEIEKLLECWCPEFLIVGLPLNMDGSDNPITIQARTFANRLTGRFQVKVLLVDERLSTFDAKTRLAENKQTYNKGDLDSLSACLILESWYPTLD